MKQPKHNKQKNRTSPHAQAQPVVNRPSQINMDDLAIMQDDELAELLHSLIESRNTVFKARSGSTRFLEEEICYAKRELQARRKRRELHDKFLKDQELESETAKLAEDQLPVADLDNVDFVQAWNMWKDRTVTLEPENKEVN